MAPIIGIDLGTTSSRAAFFRDGTPVVLENSEGEGTTPSYIAITRDGDRLVGEAARRYAVHDPTNVAFAVKRLMGRKFSDAIVQEIARYVPYEIVPAPNGDAWVRLSGSDYSPIQLSAFILQKMKQTAELYFNEPVTQAVITVPAYFNDAQRQATKDAGRIAGLEVLRIINEPTAAALAYGFPNLRRDAEARAQTIVVYDLGGGTFDVSVLEIDDGVFEVKSTRGDMQLGGEDIDYRVAHFLAQQFEREHGIDLLRDERTRQRLKQAAEHAKIELSSRDETLVDLPFVHFDGRLPLHLTTIFKRADFDALIDDLIKRTIDVCVSAMSDAFIAIGDDYHNVTVSDIDHVVLVGGSTRIPAIQRALEGHFGRRPFGGLRREDAVALGAAIQGGILGGEARDMLLLDVLPMALSIETHGRKCTPLIDRQTTIPTKKAAIFTAIGRFPDTYLLPLDEDDKERLENNKKEAAPYPDTSGAALVRVMQGDSDVPFENETLGRLVVKGIPLDPKEAPRIEITFDIDANGNLTVHAKDVSTKLQTSIEVQAATGLVREQIDAMVRDAESRPVISKEINRDVSLGADRPALQRENASEPPPVHVAVRRAPSAATPAARPGIFVSYAHEDTEWAKSLERALAILTRQNRIALFIDHHLQTGEVWKDRIFGEIEKASAAVLLFSNHFFSSGFIMTDELPMILAEHERRRLSLIPIVVRPCPFELLSDVARFQAFNDPEVPLSSMAEWKVDAEFSRLAREIAKA